MRFISYCPKIHFDCQRCIVCLPGAFNQGKEQPGREADHLVPRLKMSGSVHLSPLYAFTLCTGTTYLYFNPLKPELNPICYLLALLGAHHFLHVSRIRVKLLTFRLLMSYVYGAPILDVSRSHTTTQHRR